MIARVTLELALRKEFDYSIPPDLAQQVDVGSRVQVPFGPRKVMGCVTALAEESAYANLKPILKVIGEQALVTPKILKLARWIGEYYCCAPEIALKSVLPDAVRHEQAGWRERLFVRALPFEGELPRLAKRQKEIWNIIEERRELPLQELLELAHRVLEQMEGDWHSTPQTHHIFRWQDTIYPEYCPRTSVPGGILSSRLAWLCQPEQIERTLHLLFYLNQDRKSVV